MPEKRTAVPLGSRHRATQSSKIEMQRYHLRAREPVTRSRMTVRGRFPSIKMGRMVDWESQLERRACYRFEFSPAVLAFKEQPESIRFVLGDQYVKYTPDFELRLCNDETWLVEIKPLDHLQKPDLVQRLQAASDWYRDKGKGFIVVTDSELVAPIFESNLAFLRHFQNFELDASAVEHARYWLMHMDSPTLGALHAYYGDKKTAYVLLSQHHICINLYQTFHSDSELYLPEVNSNAQLLFSYRTAPNFTLG